MEINDFKTPVIAFTGDNSPVCLGTGPFSLHIFRSPDYIFCLSFRYVLRSLVHPKYEGLIFTSTQNLPKRLDVRTRSLRSPN